MTRWPLYTEIPRALLKEALGLDLVSEGASKVVISQIISNDVVKHGNATAGRVEAVDVVVSIDGEQVKSVQDAAIALLHVKGGVMLRFRKPNGVEFDCRVEIASNEVEDNSSIAIIEEEDSEDLQAPSEGTVWAAFGITIRNYRKRIGKKEVVIVRVERGGPAAQAGVREGDIILQLNYRREKMQTVEDFRAGVEAIAKKKPSATFEMPMIVKRASGGTNVKYVQVPLTVNFVRARFDEDNMQHIVRLNQKLYQVIGFKFRVTHHVNPSFFVHHVDISLPELSRLHRDDAVVEVDGVSVANVPAREWVALLLRGADHSKVSMAVVSSGRKVEVELTRRSSDAVAATEVSVPRPCGGEGLPTVEFLSLGITFGLKQEQIVVLSVKPHGIGEKLKIVKDSILTEVDGVSVAGIASPQDVRVLLWRPHVMLKFKVPCLKVLAWKSFIEETKYVHQLGASCSLTQGRVVMAMRLRLKLKALAGSGFVASIFNLFSSVRTIDEKQVFFYTQVLQAQVDVGPCLKVVFAEFDLIRESAETKHNAEQRIVEFAAALQQLIDKRANVCLLAMLYISLAVTQ